MTAQSYDYVFYDGNRYKLIGDSSGKLPQRDEPNIRSMAGSTGDRRGYNAEYEIKDGKLYLVKYVAGWDSNIDKFPEIDEKKPVIVLNYIADSNNLTGDVTYYLNQLMNVTGEIIIQLLGSDDRTGVRQAWGNETKYLRCMIDEGELITASDITEQVLPIVEEIRNLFNIEQSPSMDINKGNRIKELRSRYKELTHINYTFTDLS